MAKKKVQVSEVDSDVLDAAPLESAVGAEASGTSEAAPDLAGAPPTSPVAPVEGLPPQSPTPERLATESALTPEEIGTTEPQPQGSGMTLDDLLDFSLDDMFESEEDKAVLAKLRETASGDMDPQRKLALAFTALGNPRYAERMMAEDKAERGAATNTLANMASRAAQFRREGVKQVMQTDRTAAIQAASTERMHERTTAVIKGERDQNKIDNNAKMVEQRLQEMGSVRVPNMPMPPMDMSDSTEVGNWLVQTQVLLGEGVRAQELITSFTDQAMKMEHINPGTIEDAFKTHGTLIGMDPVEVSKAWSGYGPMLKAQAKESQRFADQEYRKTEAMIRGADSQAKFVASKASQIEQALESGDLDALADGVKMIGQWNEMLMDTEGLAMRLREEEVMLAQDLSSGGIDPQSFHTQSREIAKRIEYLTDHASNLQTQISVYSARTQPYLRKMDFANNYERVFDDEFERFITEVAPHYYQDPGMGLFAITTGPWNEDKQAFWYGLMGKLRAEYPNMSLGEVAKATEKSAMERMAASVGGKVLDLQGEGPMTSNQELGAWRQAKPAPEAQGQEQPAKDPRSTVAPGGFKEKVKSFIGMGTRPPAE